MINGGYFTFTLDNGIRAIHGRSRSPLCCLAITVNAGTRDEMSREHGVAHLCEHMLFKGTSRHTPLQLNRLLENRGAEVNAYTTKEDTVLHATCTRTDFSKTLRLLAEMFFESRYFEKDIRSEKEIIYDEINSYKDTPSELIFDEFENELYAGSPLGRNILGDKRQLQKIGRAEVVCFTGQRYNTDQIVVSTCGDIPDSELKAAVQRIFGRYAENSRNYARERPAARQPFRLVRHRNTHQTHCILGGKAPSMMQEDRVAAALLSNILGGPFSISLLNQSLREKKSLTYDVESSYTAYGDSGLMTVYFGCESQKCDEAYSAAIDTIAGLQRKPLGDKALRVFKNQLAGSLLIANENPEARMLSAARSLLIYGHVSQQVYEKIETVTADRIMQLANEIFSQDTLNHLIYT